MTIATDVEGAAAMKLGERAKDVPRLSTRQDDQSHTSFPALEIHSPQKTDPKVWLSHQLGNAALPALQL